MKFHINNNGKLMICRAKTKCRYSNINHIEAETLEDAQKINDIYMSGKCDSIHHAQLLYEVNTHVQYHGTNSDFKEFSDDFIGKGLDLYGPGFYFVNNQDSALHYGKNLKEVRITLNNPIFVDDSNDFNTKPHFIKDTNALKSILQDYPNIYAQPDDEETSILGDYSEEYWEHDTITKQKQEELIDRFVDKIKDYSLVDLQALFKDYPKTLMDSLYRHTKHDGIIIKDKNNIITIVWNKENIKTL